VQVNAPLHGEFERGICLLQLLDRVSVFHDRESAAGDLFDPADQPPVHMLVEKLHILPAIVEDMAAEEAEKLLGQRCVRHQVGKGHLRLYHPEFRGVPCGV
jgi:hypothetical protein